MRQIIQKTHHISRYQVSNYNVRLHM